MRSFVIGLIFIGCVASFGDADESSVPGSLFSNDGEYVRGKVVVEWVSTLLDLSKQLEGWADAPIGGLLAAVALLDNAMLEDDMDKANDSFQQMYLNWGQISQSVESVELQQAINNAMEAIAAVIQKMEAGTATWEDINESSIKSASGFEK